MAVADSKKRPRSRAVRFFVRGLATLLPIVLTLVVFGLLYRVVTDYVTKPINSVLYWSLERNALGWNGLEQLGIDPYADAYLDTSLLPVDLQTLALASDEGYSDPEFVNGLRAYRLQGESFFRDLERLCIQPERLRAEVSRRVHPVIAVILSFLLVIWLGWLVGGFVGRRVVHRLDRAMHVIPLVRTVYPYSKQIVEFFFAEKRFNFETVVAIPYPSRHLWSLAFVTSRAPATIHAKTGKTMVTCFIPSSPMPMTGYTIFVDVDDLVSMPITVDEALRVTMSGGVLIPPSEQVEGTIAEALAEEADAEEGSGGPA